MQKILVPTDFSNNALKAAGYAAEIAKKSGATIFLLHVIEPAINMATMQADSSGKKVVEERTSKLNLSLESIAEVYPHIKVIPFLASGMVISSILEYAEKEKMDMIVMGTKGASGLKKFFVGSVTAGVIGKTGIPVLTVPVSYEMEEPDAIVFATNQFEKNKELLNKIIAIPKLFSSAIHVVVFKDIDSDEHADLIYNEEQLNDYLQFLKENFPDIIFKGELLRGKDFEMTIDRYSNKNEVDIIAMVTYPKSFFEKVLQKSVTKKMAFNSTIPILSVSGID
ncbi:MAG TPA: universal stress protein [Hanamia sp.]|nr:universal stress protein [Hanamia sp.]